MAIERWATGVTSGWATAMSSEVDSLASGSSILSSVSLTNGSTTSGFDIFCDLSIKGGTATAVAAPYFLGVYIYPLGADGATFGAGNLSTAAAAVVPQAQYSVGSISVATSTAAAIVGTLNRIVMPRGTFCFALYNQTGATLPTSMTVQYYSYNRSIA